MTMRFSEASGSDQWRVMVAAALKGAISQGYEMKRLPGRGLSNIWTAEKDGKKYLSAVRTSKDRWIAFQPQNNGTEWKTLGEVDLVIVAAVDRKIDPSEIEVYIFSAEEVRERFNIAYNARKSAGQISNDNFGMWVSLDHDPRGLAASVGSGITDKYKPIARYSISEMMEAEFGNDEKKENNGVDQEVENIEEDDEPETISQIVDWAKEKIAAIAGVDVRSVKIEIKIDY
jgi:hypothetical protein